MSQAARGLNSAILRIIFVGTRLPPQATSVTKTEARRRAPSTELQACEVNTMKHPYELSQKNTDIHGSYVKALLGRVI